MEQPPVTDWNSYVISVCEQTNKVSELIARTFPDWHAERVKANEQSR